MLVSIEQNRFGHITISPVSDRIRRKYARYLRKFNHNDNGTVYMQVDTDIETLELTPSQRRNVEHGWTIRVRMDPWNYASMLGYDAAENVKL